MDFTQSAFFIHFSMFCKLKKKAHILLLGFAISSSPLSYLILLSTAHDLISKSVYLLQEKQRCGCIRGVSELTGLFPGAVQGSWKEQGEEVRNGRKLRCHRLISWPLQTDKRIITIKTVISQTFLCQGKKKKKKHSGAHLILNKYLALRSSQLFSSTMDCLARLHSHFCCI